MSSPFLDLVNERVVVYDGAFGTYVQGLDLTADDFGGDDLEGCNEILSVKRPDVVRAIHDAYFEVGVDCVETNTFGANLSALNEYDIPERIAELAQAAADGHGDELGCHERAPRERPALLQATQEPGERGRQEHVADPRPAARPARRCGWRASTARSAPSTSAGSSAWPVRRRRA